MDIFPGSLIVHALDEKARAYYNLEQLWTSKNSSKEQSQTQSQVNSFEVIYYMHDSR